MEKPTLSVTTQLTLENFWNAMMQKYPLATGEFCEWIDAYKALTMWKDVFGPFIKFHSLTYDMQVGIWINYALSHSNIEDIVEDMFTGDWNWTDDLPKMIEKFLARREEVLVEEVLPKVTAGEQATGSQQASTRKK